MKKILLIEDDSSLRENIAETLILSNYDVISAPDGKTGVETALKSKPDLILCDVMMPGIDGYGVLHILSHHPDGIPIPFIFLTGKNEVNDLRKGLGMGADDYLVKPFHDTELLNTIEMRLRKVELQKMNIHPARSIAETFFRPLEGQSEKAGKYEHRHLKKKHIIYSEDQRSGSVYYLVAGRVKEYRLHADGKVLITNIYTAGETFGHTAVLQGVNYAESTEVIEDAEVIIMPAVDFIRTIQGDSRLAWVLLRLISADNYRKDLKLLNMAYNSLRKKVAVGIIEVANKFKAAGVEQTCLDISRDDLSHIVGSAPESMIRTLKEFKTEELIDVQDGKIVILNEQKLSNLPY